MTKYVIYGWKFNYPLNKHSSELLFRVIDALGSDSTSHLLSDEQSVAIGVGNFMYNYDGTYEPNISHDQSEMLLKLSSILGLTDPEIYEAYDDDTITPAEINNGKE